MSSARPVLPTPLPATGPALGLIETGSVARGMVVADEMAKRALITLLEAHPVTPGKFVVLVVGGEEEVAQAMALGIHVAGDTLIDRLLLSKADPQLAPALSGGVQVSGVDELAALGIVETYSVASALQSADIAVKAAEVRLVQLRLARGLGGRAYYVLSGDLPQVEAGVEAGRGIIHDGMLLTSEIIARPHEDLLRQLLLSPEPTQVHPFRR